jgi:hypothetical protein
VAPARGAARNHRASRQFDDIFSSKFSNEIKDLYGRIAFSRN